MLSVAARRNLDILAGVVLAAIAPLAIARLGGFAARTEFGKFLMIPLAAAALFPGVTQLLYIVPCVMLARRAGRPGLGRGLILGASMVFVLNAFFAIHFFLYGI